MNQNLGLYIGCGLDIEIMSLLKDEFLSCIYIDSQPMTRNGDFKCNTKEYSQQYMVDFKYQANKNGFIKINIDGTYPHVYRNNETNQEIYHYFNLSFPIYQKTTHHTANIDQLNALKYKLRGVTHLIVIEFSPHYSILNNIINNVTFVGNYSTLFKQNIDNLLEYEKEKLTIILQKNMYNIRSRIKNYIYLDKNCIKKNTTSYDDFISVLSNT